MQSVGVRLIACGLLLRRLVTKVILRPELRRLKEVFLPTQVGCAIQGGIEAAVHAARLYATTDHPSCTVFVKLDFSNAFNLLRRDWMLEQVEAFAPSLLPLVRQAYGSKSLLWIGDQTLDSATGIQQGDPAGPALFCLGTKLLTDSFTSEFSVAYLDDITLAGSLDKVLIDIKKVIEFESRSGLKLNPNKCEAFVISEPLSEGHLALTRLREVIPGLRQVPAEELELLGSPLLEDAMKRVVVQKELNFQKMFDRLCTMNSQQAWFLLRNSMGAPKITHLLRTAPLYESSSLLSSLTSLWRRVAEKLLNVQLNDRSWLQVSLPLCAGGLGVRNPEDLAAPCYVSSLYATAELTKSLLGAEYSTIVDRQIEAVCQSFAECTGALTDSINWTQDALDKIMWEPKQKQLWETSTSAEDKARILAAGDPLSRKWLNALPSSQIGTLLDSNTFRVCAGLRLGAPICHPHQCSWCGLDVDA